MLALVLTLVPVLMYNAKYPTISPIDEFHHIDYAERLSDGDLIGLGDRFGLEMMREFSCRRLDASEIAFEVPACDAPDSALTPDRYPENGYNVAYIHPPTYYANAAVGGSIAELFGKSFVAGARLANVAWLGAFIVAIFVAARWLGCKPIVALMASVPCVVNPVSLHALATVNPDAAGLACGAAALVGYLGWRRGGSLWWLALVVAPIAVKSTHGLVSGAIVCLIAAEAWLDRPKPFAPRAAATTFRPVFAAGFGLVGVAAAVLLLQKSLASAPATVIDQLSRFHAERFPIDQMLANVIVVPPFYGYLPRHVNERSVLIVITLMTLMVMLGMVLGLANRRDPADQVLRNVGVAALGMSVLAGPALIVLNYSINEIFVAIPSRYLISLVPMLVLVGAAAFARHLLTRWGWIALTALVWTVMVLEMAQESTLGVT
ncbi:MAG: hypothetical protein GX868_14830 [Actinobacteria bacterium]|nr:hypothetical protein [Actinomycetota bacterium]